MRFAAVVMALIWLQTCNLANEFAHVDDRELIDALHANSAAIDQAIAELAADIEEASQP